MLGPVVYLLCFIACLLCGLLLARSYTESRSPLLLWSALCFGFLAFTQLLVVVDLVFAPAIDMQLARNLTSLVATAILLYGFIWRHE